MKTILGQYKKFKFFLGPQVWFLFRLSLAIGLFWFLVESSFVFVLQAFLSAVGLLKGENGLLSRFYPASTLGAVILLFLFGVFRAMALMARQVSSEMTNQAFLRTQRVRIIEYALSNASSVSTHDLLNVFNERIPTTATIIQFVSTLATISISSACFFLLGLYLAPVETAMGVGLLLTLFLLLRFINKRIDLIGQSLFIETKRLTRSLVVGLRNHFLLKLYRLTDDETEAGKAAAVAYQNHYIRYIWLAATKAAFPQFAGALIICLVCLFSFHFIHTTGARLVSFIYVFMRLAQSLSEANAVFVGIRLNMSSFRELYHWTVLSENYMESKKGERRVTVATPVGFERGVCIEGAHLSFGFDSSRPLFSDISFKVGPGEVLLLKGPSGAGKSTLLTVIFGLRRADSGEVLINGRGVSEVLPELAPTIAYVGPESYLVPGTYRDNLLYANPSAKGISDEELWSCLRLVLLEDLVSRDLRGLDAEIREMAEISTGQRQRLAIARAILRHPKVLILDEATANLDPETEQEIVRMIRDLSRGLTIIAISHKDSFDKMATLEINMKK